MKKTSLKLLATFIIILVISFFQEFIRNYFLIDKRIWFIVQYIGGGFVLIFILLLFYNEIQPINTFIKNFGLHTIKFKQNSKLSKNILKLLNVIGIFICILTSALISFSLLYPDTSYNYIWIKIITIISCFIMSLFTFIIFRNINLFSIYICTCLIFYGFYFIIFL